MSLVLVRTLWHTPAASMFGRLLYIYIIYIYTNRFPDWKRALYNRLLHVQNVHYHFIAQRSHRFGTDRAQRSTDGRMCRWQIRSGQKMGCTAVLQSPKYASSARQTLIQYGHPVLGTSIRTIPGSLSLTSTAQIMKIIVQA